MAWRNCLGGKLRFLPESFVFPTMTLPNLVRMWYNGDVPSNIPPYKMLRTCDVSHLKHGKCKLYQMNKLLGHVERAASIVNQPHLVRKYCTEEHAFALYNAVKSSFLFDTIKVGKRQRYESISWKTYYNNLSKRKWKLLGEVSVGKTLTGYKKGRPLPVLPKMGRPHSSAT